MSKKTIFLDIDGTITDFMGNIPESAKQAMIRAKAAGHRLVLCTGRPKSQIYTELIDMTFDGIIASTGAYVECDGKEIYSRHIDAVHMQKLCQYFDTLGAPYMMQCADEVVMNQKSADQITRHFMDAGMTEEMLLKVTVCTPRIAEDVAVCTHVEKAAYYDAMIPLQELRAALGDYFIVETSSYETDQASSGEITIKGETKSSGIKRYMDHMKLDTPDTIGIGDGINDLDMLNLCHVAVAMGNAVEAVKEAADFVTAAYDKDGLSQAFEKLGLY